MDKKLYHYTLQVAIMRLLRFRRKYYEIYLNNATRYFHFITGEFWWEILLLCGSDFRTEFIYFQLL